MCLDELQLAKNLRGRTNFDVYKLAQGVGRTRGNRSGGIDLTPTWRNCILTTGESPLTSLASGAGAVNRVAMAAAAIILVDELACNWIFDGKQKPLTADEIFRVFGIETDGQRGRPGIIRCWRYNR